LEKQSLSPIKVFNDFFEEMEKGFLLEEDYWQYRTVTVLYNYGGKTYEHWIIEKSRRIT
jgi:hypothetical protein